jgi:cobaltochelatase CobN
MSGQLLLRLLLPWLLALSAAGQTQQPVRVVLITPYPQMVPGGLQQFERTHGRQRLDLEILSASSAPARLERAQVICFVHNSTTFTPEQQQALVRAAARGAVVTASFPDLVEQRVKLKADVELSLQVEEYWKNGGPTNIAAFFALIYNTRARSKLAVQSPQVLRSVGVYHPAARELFPTLAEYLAWYRSRGRLPATAPVAGLTFFHTAYKTGDLAHIDAFVAELEKQGLIPAAMCGWPPARELPKLFQPNNHPLRLLFVMNYNFARPEDAELLEAIGIPAIGLMNTRQEASEWAESPHGVPPESLAQQVAAPERAGVTEPIVIATSERVKGSNERYNRPIAERIAAAVARGKRWLTLQNKPNAEKRLAMLYYNNPAGKGGIGASYLHVPGTIRALLDRLLAEGYQTGGTAPDEKTLIGMLESGGRNIEVWAPGELERMVSQQHLVLISMAKYRRWFGELPPRFQAMVNQHWGAPEKTRLMTIRDRDGAAYFVVPGVRFGNVFLGPQPLKSSFEEASKAQHNTAIPPPHAYIAAYLWYRNEFKADAMIHLGRHGTLEFLPGKNVGQTSWDASEVLLGDLPNAYYYIMDGGGESTIARRRSAAVLISHLTPMVAQAGQQTEFDELRRLLKDYEDSDSEPLKAEYEKGIRAQIRLRKLDGQIGLKPDNVPFAQTFEEVKAFLEETEVGAIPLGIHIAGKAPREELQQEAVAQFLRTTFKDPTSAEAKAAADNWLARLRSSPPIELDALPRILSGRFQPSGMSGDPLRTPEALPSGRNLHDFDPTRIPTKEACTVGKRMAGSMLDEYKQRRAAYPSKISMVLWYGETARHLGVMECQAMYLLGVEPVWNNRGIPDSLRLIPIAELGRPRIDVVYTLGGIYRDGFPDKVFLLDKATQLAASAENGENAIARNTAAIATTLRQSGVDEVTAARAARARAFAAAPGDYGAAIARIAKQSKDQDGELVATYLNHMGHAYSTELWGQSVPKALSSHLKGNQVVLNSRSSSVYGVLDNDDFFEFTGGLNAATREANEGNAPEFFVVDVRRRGGERVTPMKKYLATELNARFWNPKWIQEMQRGGYAGAREIADNMENLYGWQATTKEIMDGAFWQNSYDVYVGDKHKLNMKEFLTRENPHARQAMLARLLEVDRQGSYRFSDADRGRLVREFVASVNQFKAACNANVCGNRRLRQYAAAEARQITELSPDDLRQFEQQYRETSQVSREQSQAAPPRPKLPAAAAKPKPSAVRPLFERVFILTPEEWERLSQAKPFGFSWLWFFAPIPFGMLHAWFRRRLFAHGPLADGILRIGSDAPPSPET